MLRAATAARQPDRGEPRDNPIAEKKARSEGLPSTPMTLVGDRERERTAQELRRHYVAGRLDDTELSERLELVLRARSRWELAYALRRLPRVEDLVLRVRHGAVVAVLGAVWLMLTVALVVAFVA